MSERDSTVLLVNVGCDGNNGQEPALLLDGGRVIEEGTYDQLIRRNGCFAELVERQRLDK